MTPFNSSPNAHMWTPTLAHLGGIDEIGVFLVPALVAILVLRWVERRARERRHTPESSVPPESNEATD